MALSSRGASPLLCLEISSSAALLPRGLPTPAALVRARPPSTRARRGAAASSGVAARAAGDWNLGSWRGGGTGLLERPAFDQSQFDPLPQVQEGLTFPPFLRPVIFTGGDIGKLTDKKGLGSGDSFRVLLIDDARHTETLVEKALPPVVPSITPSDARKLFHESRQNGVAVVIVTVKEHAEFYAQMMVRSGLRSAIEPDSSAA